MVVVSDAYLISIAELNNNLGDPWREVTMSASHLPDQSTDLMTIALGGGYHCDDMSIVFGTADPTIAAVQKHAFASFASWMAHWRGVNNVTQISTTTLAGAVSNSEDEKFSDLNMKTLLRNSYIGIGLCAFMILLLLGIIIKILIKPRQSGYKPILAASKY